jgi:arsenate reductase
VVLYSRPRAARCSGDPLSTPGLSVEVQVFGVKKNQDVRKALRFWSERRVKVHFVDFKDRAPSHGELLRFAQRFGITALIDKTSKRYADLGLGVVRYDDTRWMQTLCEEPLVLLMPLTRFQQHVTVGLAEGEWSTWIARGTT